MKKLRTWLPGLTLAGTAVFAMAIGIIAIYPDVLHRRNWRTFEVAKRQYMLSWIWTSLLRYEESHGGQSPSSIAEVIEADPDTWRDNPSMHAAIQKDRNTYRVLQRAVFLRDAPKPRGGRFRWVLAVLVPNEGRFSAIQQDYVYGFTEDSLGDFVAIEDANRVFGPEVVKAAYRKDREARAAATTSASGP